MNTTDHMIIEAFANGIYDAARNEVTPTQLRDACLGVICGLVSSDELPAEHTANALESIARGLRNGVPFVTVTTKAKLQ